MHPAVICRVWGASAESIYFAGKDGVVVHYQPQDPTVIQPFVFYCVT